MDTSHHNLKALFEQLGLPSQPHQIDAFIAKHRTETGLDRLEGAPFWSPSQAHFLQKALQEDSDWFEVADELNTRLHQ